MPRFPYFPYQYSKNPQYSNQFINNSINKNHLPLHSNINPTPKNLWQNENSINNITSQYIPNVTYTDNVNNSNTINRDHNHSKSDYINLSQKNTSSETRGDTTFLELFGLKLYFDDILILCLLYFLYTEDIKDEGLFIALILLLIT